VLRFQAGTVGIHAVPGAPIAVETIEGEGLAILENGDLPFVEGSDFELPVFRDAADLGGEPPAAQMVFEKSIDTIERSAPGASGDDEPRPGRPKMVAFGAERRDVDIDSGPPRCLLSPSRISFRARHGRQDRLEFLRPVPDRRGGVFRDDDPVIAPPVLGQDKRLRLRPRTA
jgi:hypothetical protein